MVKTLEGDLFTDLQGLDKTPIDYSSELSISWVGIIPIHDTKIHVEKLDDYILQHAKRLCTEFVKTGANDAAKISNYAKFMMAQGEYLAKTASSQPALKTKPQSHSKKLPTAAVASASAPPPAPPPPKKLPTTTTTQPTPTPAPITGTVNCSAGIVSVTLNNQSATLDPAKDIIITMNNKPYTFNTTQWSLWFDINGKTTNNKFNMKFKAIPRICKTLNGATLTQP